MDSELKQRNVSAMDSDKTDDISDGYHAFEELYHHRVILFAAIVNENFGWKSKLHNDGTMYEGYFIAGFSTPYGQATYHCELKYWNIFDCKELPFAPEWDGHTPAEAIERIKKYLCKPKQELDVDIY